MGINQTGILSGVSGTVGPVVGAIVNGQSTLRAKPKKSTKTPTQLQVNQRTRFGLITSYLSEQKDTIDIGYQSVQGTLSPINAAVQYNLKNAITGIAPAFSIDYPSVQISKGNLPGSATMAVVAAAGGLLNFTWDMTAELGAADQLKRGTDEGVIVVYGLKEKHFITVNGTSSRAIGTMSFKIPRIFNGDTLHTWFFFKSADGKSVSTSRYLGAPVGLA